MTVHGKVLWLVELGTAQSMCLVMLCVAGLQTPVIQFSAC